MAKPRVDIPLTSQYKSLARILQETAPDLSSVDARAKLVAALMDAKITPLVEVGKRNNASDQQVLQTIHDHSVSLGAACAEPDMDEAADKSSPQDGVRLVESCKFPQDIRLSESAGGRPVLKIIDSGRGSTGFYTKELLQRDGPIVFGKGTLGFINHATDAEEAARPEGDYNNLAYVTTEAARWIENHPEGAALYAPVSLFQRRADEIKEKAPHTGASIRARGQYAEASTGLPNPKIQYHESKIAPDGKPGLIAKLTSADSIDLVTKAGRGGKLLLESAGVAEIPKQENAMDEAQIKALIKESVAPIETKLSESQAENKKLRDRLARSEAPRVIREALADIRLPEASKNKIIRRLAETDLPEDAKKLNEMVEAEAKAEADFLQELGYGNGIAAVGTRMTEAQTQEQSAAGDKDHKESLAKSYEWLAHTFVGKPLRVGTEEAKAARVEAIEAFKEGRAA